MSPFLSLGSVARPVLQSSSSARARLALVLCAGLSLGIAGCDRDTSTSVALKKAEAEIRGLIPGREHVPHQQLRDTAYGNILTTLQPVMQKGTDSEKAAAAAMIAQAHAGLAEAPALRATELELETHAAAIRLRAAHTEFLTQSAKADSAAGYDSRVELEGIEGQVRKLDQEQAAAEQRKAGIDNQVQQLLGQATELMNQARKHREQAATIKGRIPNETATRGEEMMQQAYDITRQADALELQAATLEAQAAKIKPDSDQAQLDIERIHNQKQLLAQAREQVQQRAQARRAEAAAARDHAAKVAEEIRGIVRATDSMRSGELARVAEEAAQKYEQAASTAQQAASRGARAAAYTAVGSYRQSQGDLYWNRAQGEQDWATILESLATSKPPVAAEFQTLAGHAREKAKGLLDQATEAYKAAWSAYESAGATGEAAQHMQRIHEALNRSVSATSGGSQDLGSFTAAAPDMGEAPMMDDGGAGAVDESTPNGTLAALKAMSDSGDFSRMGDYFVTSTPEQRQMVQFMTTVAPAGLRLQKAMEQRFGSGGDALPMGGGGMVDMDVDPSSVEFDIDGERATAWVGDDQVTMQQEDGRWKVVLDFAELPPEAAQMLPMLAPHASTIAQVMESVAAEVESGKYNSEAEVGAVIQQKMAEIMMRSMRGGGG